jgi:hypothetical protein
MPKRKIANVKQVNFSLTTELHKNLMQQAKRNKRSLNEEVLQRLMDSFGMTDAEVMLARARAHLETAERLYKQSLDYSFAHQAAALGLRLTNGGGLQA